MHLGHLLKFLDTSELKNTPSFVEMDSSNVEIAKIPLPDSEADLGTKEMSSLVKAMEVSPDQEREIFTSELKLFCCNKTNKRSSAEKDMSLHLSIGHSIYSIFQLKYIILLTYYAHM